MPRGRALPELTLSDHERSQLFAIARSRTLPHGIVRRAEIVLASADGESNKAIAKRMRLTQLTVGNGVGAISPKVLRVYMTNCVPDGREPSRTSASPK
jgi:hypothetical protein